MGGLLLNILRKGDTPGRFGGEELIFALRDTPMEGAKAFAERVRKLVEGHAFIYEKARIPVTASFGVATSVNENFKTAEECLKAADELLYKAKNSGRNKVVSLLD
jgi:diguanylate cyclase (GGDEF)-like protein